MAEKSANSLGCCFCWFCLYVFLSKLLLKSSGCQSLETLPPKMPLVTALEEAGKGSLHSLQRIPYLQTRVLSQSSVLAVEALIQNAGKPTLSHNS